MKKSPFRKMLKIILGNMYAYFVPNEEAYVHVQKKSQWQQPKCFARPVETSVFNRTMIFTDK